MTPAEIHRTLQDAQTLHRDGRLAEAEEVYQRIVHVLPGNPDLWHLFGVIAFQQGRPEAAIERYRKAVALRPGFLQAHNNLAIALKSLERWDEAIASYRGALSIKPDYAEALGNLGILFEARGAAALLRQDFDSAAELMEQAAMLAPDDATIAFELGLALEGCADDDGALAAFARAGKLDPGSEEFRWSEALLLPRIPRDDEEVGRALRRFDEGLAQVESGLRLDSEAGRAAALDAASRVAPLGLHYLPGDHTARQSRYGDIVARCTRASLPNLAPPARERTSSGRQRVGFVSAHLREHVVARFFADFIVKMDAGAFEKLVWSLGESRDSVTDEVAAASDRFSAGNQAIERIAQDIREADLDALVYLDVGLDPATTALASLRLAPLQCACYGHPVTTGLESVDFFLGAELLETPASDVHYRERLVRLPGLGASIRAGPAAGDGRWADALREGSRPVAMCLQNLSKIPPSFDATLAEFLARSGARLVLFDRGARLTARFRERFVRALDERGVPGTTIHVEPAHDRATFLGGIARADLILDTPNFSGGATSLDALASGAPVVAFEGTTARGRQTSAMLRTMEVDELVAKDEDAYVRIAVDLLADRARCTSIRDHIRANAPQLFGDTRPIAALEELLRTGGRAP